VKWFASFHRAKYGKTHDHLTHFSA
jgi:hypothetical protein